jgi:hypothetical protein
MMSSKVLHEAPDFVRVSRVFHNVLDYGQDSGGVHFEGGRDEDPVNFYCIEFVKVRQNLRLSVKKGLKGLTPNHDQVPVERGHGWHDGG